MPAALVVAIAVAVAVACAGPRAGGPQESPAPAFSYITDEQLESAMWELAAGVESLRMIFAKRQPIRPDQREEVIRILDQMIAAADELGPDGVSSNHPRVTHNLGRFREKLAIARDSASLKPPRYYLVGNLSGTCLACHGSQ
jgi:hypothetical protein